MLDVVLIAAAAVFAWNLLSGPSPRMGAGDDATTASTASQAPSDAATDAAQAPAAVLAAFASPSSNITCEITADDVTCSIWQLAQQPAPVDTCDGTVGYRVTIDAASGEVKLPCVPTSEQPQKAPGDMQKLDYDQSVTQGQFTCSSSKSGVNCKDNESGKGFTIAKAGIAPY